MAAHFPSESFTKVTQNLVTNSDRRFTIPQYSAHRFTGEFIEIESQ